MFIPNGEVLTSTNKTSYHTTAGAVSSCCFYKLEKMSRNEISLPIDQPFFWTDSTCVLRYIENTNKRFQTFVANRIATIHDASTPTQWNYVDTHSNPADDASRGVRADSLQRWIDGPDFLTQSTTAWPKRHEEVIANVPNDDPEVKKNMSGTAEQGGPGGPTLPPNNFPVID